jgi:hypothetical protein
MQLCNYKKQGLPHPAAYTVYTVSNRIYKLSLRQAGGHAAVLTIMDGQRCHILHSTYAHDNVCIQVLYLHNLLAHQHTHAKQPAAHTLQVGITSLIHSSHACTTATHQWCIALVETSYNINSNMHVCIRKK